MIQYPFLGWSKKSVGNSNLLDRH